MKTRLTIILTSLILFASGQMTNEGKDFIKKLYLDLKPKTTVIDAFTTLKASSDVKNVVSGDDKTATVAYLKSHPIFNIGEWQQSQKDAFGLTVFFKDNKSYQKRIIIDREKDYKNYNTITSLLKSVSSKTDLDESKPEFKDWEKNVADGKECKLLNKTMNFYCGKTNQLFARVKFEYNDVHDDNGAGYYSFILTVTYFEE
ncbi:MAG: hypothetical protein SFY56_10195 [Bacteroidota bacterium]|nr:hypothetical protein [Bacteroidota bacterium]